MKKMWKRVLASVLAIVLCAGTFMTVKWQTVAAEESTDGLKVIGASIRFINADTAVDGIRFAVGVKADALTDETKSNYHLLVMPTALLTDGELTKGETYSYTAGEETKYAYAQDIKIDWAKATEETIDNTAYKVVRIYLNEIGANYYTTSVTARAYYQDGENDPVYSAAIERSYYSVANAALDDLNATEVADKFDNKVGNSYSPYDATQRDALLGVKYVKTGTWDYVDGLLVQQSAIESDSLTDRVVKSEVGKYTIRTSLKTKTIEEIGTDLFGGIHFAYNSEKGAFLELDYRKTDDNKLVPSIRVKRNFTKWDGYIGGASGFTLEEDTMYEFDIAVNETATKFDVRVHCRKSGTTDAFKLAVQGSVTINEGDAFGDQVRMYAGRNLSGNTFSAELGVSDGIKYEVEKTGNGNAALSSYTENSVTVTQATDTYMKIKDLHTTTLPNTDDFIVQVDMSPLYKNSKWAWTRQGLRLGNCFITLNSGQLYINDGSTEQRFNSNDTGDTKLPLPDGLILGSAEFKPFTFIVRGYKVDSQMKLDILVKVDGVETFLKTVNIVELANTDIVYYASKMDGTNCVEDMTTTFSNLQVSEGVDRYTMENSGTGAATMTQTPNSVTVTQAKDTWIKIKDLQVPTLPNTDDFIVQVDMSPLYKNSKWAWTRQGLRLGDCIVALNSGQLYIDQGGAIQRFTYDGTGEAKLTLPDGLMINSAEFKPFTFIVKGYKVENQMKLDISVKVDGVETFLKTVNINALASADLVCYTAKTNDQDCKEDMTTTFSNLQITDGIPKRYELSKGTATLTQTPNSVTVTQADRSWVRVKDLQVPTLPNTDNFIVQVDMSAIHSKATVVKGGQGLELGNCLIRLNRDTLGISQNGLTNYSTYTTDENLKISLPNGINFDVDTKPYTFIVKGYKVESQMKLDICVKVDGVETLIKTVNIKDLGSTQILYYSYADGLGSSMTTTFSNLTTRLYK